MFLVKSLFYRFFNGKEPKISKNRPISRVICGNRGHFRAKGHKIKVVGNAILKIFCFMTFFLGRIL